MDTLLRIIAVLIGLVGLVVYFRSIIRVMLLNWRERDIVSHFAATAAVTMIRRFTDIGATYERIQRSQAWIFPVFVILSVAFWFLLVQICFTFILWGTGAEPSIFYAFTASGSALSTLGFKTPPSWLGEFLAIVEGAMGLAIVVLLFSFVPGYLAAVQARERNVGRLHDRTHGQPTYENVLQAMHSTGKDLNDADTWEEWEEWFRGIYETHTTAPILVFVPSIYRGANWVRTSASILDTASLLMSVLDEKETYAIRMCRKTGIAALHTLSEELRHSLTPSSQASVQQTQMLEDSFYAVYEQLIAMKVKVKADKETCLRQFISLRDEYATSVNNIARITLSAP
ncbi:hypothetical protein AVM02_03140 [Brucella anthropi]|uniref:hypothetical protein n=1 Tax=Brucella anthropi TaxID=529 RepID=UPI003986EFCE